MKAVIYVDKQGRLWWISESHPQTDRVHVVCRAVERGRLAHTAVMSRNDLKFYLLTEMNDGIVDMPAERLNDSVETDNSKA